MRTILVLRASEDAARTQAKLRDMGFVPILSPVIEIVATGAASPTGPYDAVLATSAKGLTFAAGDLDALRAVPLHVVGARTAKIAQALGWRPQFIADEARSLLPLLLAHYGTPVRFLYLAGHDRRQDLETTLREAGHEVTIVETYAARAAEGLTEEARQALAMGRIDAVLHYSKRSAEIFLSLAQAANLDERARDITHLALSSDVATPLQEQGCKDIRVAERPEESHLFQLLAE